MSCVLFCAMQQGLLFIVKGTSVHCTKIGTCIYAHVHFEFRLMHTNTRTRVHVHAQYIDISTVCSLCLLPSTTFQLFDLQIYMFMDVCS